MCPKGITSVFAQTPKTEKPKPAATAADAAVTDAGDAARRRQAAAVNSNTNRLVTNDELDDSVVVRPKLLGS